MIDNTLEHVIDVYGDGSIIKTLIHDCEEEWNVTGTRKYTVDGHIDVTVPFDEHVIYDKFWERDYEDVVREAQRRNIKEISIRCEYWIVLTNDDWGRVERDGFNTRDVIYSITLLSYATFDSTVIELDNDHPSVFANYLHRQVHSSILSKIDDVRPTSIVTTRRV